MFVGREHELSTLERCFASDRFELVVLYGRRRVGKTTLLAEFARGKRAIFFTAQEQSDRDNLADFSRAIAAFFALPEGTLFSSWDAAFDYVADRAAEEPFLLIFDEFPYAAQSNPALPSKLQVAVDHRLKGTALCLVLCGSSQGFMENSVLGQKSPLHGRRTAQMKLEPFGYRDAARMLGSSVACDDAFRYYACIGGIPYYLSLVDPSLSFRENLRALYFSPEGYLFGEPTMLLRQELREPAIYHSVLRSVAHGANRQSAIADRAGVRPEALSRYLGTLRELGLLERIVPFGEDPARSRKGIYRLRDACYDFWYRFVAPSLPDIEAGAGQLVAESLREDALSEYLGRRFERVCLEWLLEEALGGKLPLRATSFGSWWGNDPVAKEQTDIDVVAANRGERAALLGECKYRESFDETAVAEKLLSKDRLLPGYEVVDHVVFSRHRASQASREKYRGAVRFVCLGQMYEFFGTDCE